MSRHVPRPSLLGATFLLAAACAPTAGQAPTSAPATPPAAPTGVTVSQPPASLPATPASPVAAPSGEPLGTSRIDQPLTAGGYRIGEPFGAPFRVSLPPGWRLKALEQGDAGLAATLDGEHYPAWVVVDLIDNVIHDPCGSPNTPIDPPVAQGVDAFVDALTHMTGFTAGPVSDVTLGHHRGKAVELVNRIDTEASGCANSPMLPLWTYRGGGGASTNGHARERLRLIDVDGTPVVIDGETFEDTPPDLRDEMQRIVDSIRFE